MKNRKKKTKKVIDEEAKRKKVGEEEKLRIAVEVATRYYKEKQTQKEIADAMGLKHTSSVSRLLDFAEKEGIVTITINPEPEERPIRNHVLEARLMNTFELSNCIVVDNVGYKEGFDRAQDEKIHRVLAKALTEELRCVIRSKDHIGVLGGRGTYYTALALNDPHLPRLRQTDVVVTSLGGNVSTTALAEERISVDADSVASQLCRAFVKAELRRLCLPVAVPSPQIKEEFLERGQGRAISPQMWEKDPSKIPNIVLLGIGALDIKSKYHRFLHLDGYEPIRNCLEELIKIMSTLAYCPVGDIGYRLFKIKAPNMRISKQMEDNIDNKISDLNDRIIAISKEQLRLVDRVIAIAGGPVKVNAIYQILKDTETKPLIHELCTDVETVNALIEIERESSTFYSD